MPYGVVDGFHIAGVHFRAWGFMVGLGLFLGAWLTTRLGARRGVEPDRIWTLAMVSGAFGLLGARVFWALQPDLIAGTLEDPLRILRVWDGGLTFIGGLLGALLGGVWYVRRSGLPVWRVADLAAPGFGLGLAVGRIGCYLTGLHPGSPTDLPWGIDYLGAVRHPIPLYESILGLALAGAAYLLLRRTPRPGLVGLATAAAYLIGRSLLDVLRAPEGLAGADPRLLGGLTLTQGMSIVLVPILVTAAAGLIFHGRREAEPSVAPESVEGRS